MSDTQKGRDFVLNVTTDSGITFKTVGMVNTKDFSQSLPIQNVTAQDTPGPFSDHCHSGFKQMGLTVSGVVRERAGTDPVSSLVYFTFKELAAIVNSSTVSGAKLEIQLISPIEKYEGIFLISEFSQTGPQEEVTEFSMTLQNEGDVAWVAIP